MLEDFSILGRLRKFLLRLKSFLSHIKWQLEDLFLLFFFPVQFEIVSFRLFDSSDPKDEKWKEWSRRYEYEFALKSISELRGFEDLQIHNTCWGYHGIHVKFKEELEERFVQITNSDIRPSGLPNTQVYDLRKKPQMIWNQKFDFVVNISTIEEIEASHLRILKNLLLMVKPEGYLIATFDIPGINLKIFEKLFNREITRGDYPIHAEFPNRKDVDRYLHCGLVVLRRKLQ